MSEKLPAIRLQARGLILSEDGRIFCVRSQDGGKVRDYLALPGGGVEAGESLEDAARREIREELGVEARIGRLLFINQYHSAEHNNDACDFIFLVENWADFLGAKVTDGEHGAEELVDAGFFDQRSSNILPKFLCKVDLVEFVENHPEVGIYEYF